MMNTIDAAIKFAKGELKLPPKGISDLVRKLNDYRMGIEVKYTTQDHETSSLIACCGMECSEILLFKQHNVSKGDMLDNHEITDITLKTISQNDKYSSLQVVTLKS